MWPFMGASAKASAEGASAGAEAAQDQVKYDIQSDGKDTGYPKVLFDKVKPLYWRTGRAECKHAAPVQEPRAPGISSKTMTNQKVETVILHAV